MGDMKRIALLAALGAVQLYGAEPPATIHPSIWPQVRPQVPPDPALERRVMRFSPA